MASEVKLICAKICILVDHENSLPFTVAEAAHAGEKK